jgi:molybdenum cofactor biosynthesis enzyme
MKVYPLEAIGQLELCNHLGANERGTTCQKKKVLKQARVAEIQALKDSTLLVTPAHHFWKEAIRFFFSFPFGP